VQQPWLLIVLLPINAAVGGVIGGRWAMRPAPAPGFAIGLLSVAVQMGLGMRAGGSILTFITIDEALLQIIAAITGGLIGTVLARRAGQAIINHKTERPALS
jgi:hypothetical protein